MGGRYGRSVPSARSILNDAGLSLRSKPAESQTVKLAAHPGLRQTSQVMSRADEPRGYYDNVHYSSEKVPESIPGKLALSDPWYQLILDFFARNQIEVGGRRVLEVGCGLGGLCLRFAAEGAAVTGLDFSKSVLRSASRLVRKQPGGRAFGTPWPTPSACPSPTSPSTW